MRAVAIHRRRPPPTARCSGRQSGPPLPPPPVKCASLITGASIHFSTSAQGLIYNGSEAGEVQAGCYCCGASGRGHAASTASLSINGQARGRRQAAQDTTFLEDMGTCTSLCRLMSCRQGGGSGAAARADARLALSACWSPAAATLALRLSSGPPSAAGRRRRPTPRGCCSPRPRPAGHTSHKEGCRRWLGPSVEPAIAGRRASSTPAEQQQRRQ